MTRLLLLVASLAPLLDRSVSHRQADQQHVKVRCVIREGEGVTSLPAFTVLSTRKATFPYRDAALVVVPSIQENGMIEIAAKVHGAAGVVALPRTRLKPGLTVRHALGGCEIEITPTIEQ